MPTNKPRVTFTISQEMLSEVESYRFDGRFKNQTQAILSLIEKGLEDFSHKSKKTPSISDEAMKVAKDYDSLDTWGKRAVRAVTDSELARVEADNTFDADAEAAYKKSYDSAQRTASSASSTTEDIA